MFFIYNLFCCFSFIKYYGSRIIFVVFLEYMFLCTICKYSQKRRISIIFKRQKSMALVIAVVTQDILGISKSLFERPWHILDILIYLYFQGCEALEQGIVDILYVFGLYA